MRLIAVIACFLSLSAHAETFAGKVVGVADGDTITVLHVEGDKKTPRKVRISGIDAPESKQAFGNRAKEAMRSMAHGQTATADCINKKTYSRDICVVRVNGVDVGLSLVEQGLAWHYKKYERDQASADRVTYARAEVAARGARRGLWGDLGTAAPPVPPWDFRRKAD